MCVICPVRMYMYYMYCPSLIAGYFLSVALIILFQTLLGCIISHDVINVCYVIVLKFVVVQS